MAILLADLWKETKEKYELELVGGFHGLNREMTWVYVAEDQTNASFLRPGELIISTGALYNHTEKWLLHFIRTLWSNHTCGLILNIGKHLSLSDLTQPVIDFCNEHDFPLFVMPWHIHIYDITRDYYDRIFAESKKDNSPDFYKLLSEIKNPTVLDQFVQEKLHAVLTYDEQHKSCLADTLFLYLKYWGNISEIASQSYCHRNTVTNRLHILEEQLYYHLSDPFERFELMTAFMVREYNKLKK